MRLSGPREADRQLLFWDCSFWGVQSHMARDDMTLPDPALAQAANHRGPRLARTLIAYSTVDGHTLRISTRLQQSLERLGHEVVLSDIGKRADLNPRAFDQVVIGASIRYGKYRREVYEFIETHRAALDRMPSAFFSVNVVARKPGKDTADSNPYVKSFRRKTKWSPGEVAVFAGMIDYPKYRFLDRQVIRFIMWLTNGPTDPTARVDFTDWQAVERFAGVLANLGSAK